MKKLSLIVSLTIACLSCSPVRQDAEIGALVEPVGYFVKPSQTIDGDTITVAEIDDITQEITVDLCGIDAPELEGSGGVESREALIQILNQAPDFIVYIVARDDFSGDEYDNAEVFFLGTVDGKEQDIFVNAEMMRLGYAQIENATVSECLNSYLLEETNE